MKMIVWFAIVFGLVHDSCAILFVHDKLSNSNKKPPSISSDQMKQIFELKANYAETG